MSFQIQSYEFTKAANQMTMWLEYRPYATTGIVYVQFSDNATGEVLGTNRVDIPEDVYAEWTTSDDTLVNYVIGELGVTLQ